MNEYTFDASVTVEAESQEKAADLILEHCMTGADIACALYTEGTLNVKELSSRLDQIMKDGTEYAQDMEARLIKRVAQIDELQSQLDSVLVLLREVSESETWELGTDLNRRIEAAIKAPK